MNLSSKDLIKHKLLELIINAREKLGVSKDTYIDLRHVIVKKLNDFDEFTNSTFYLLADEYIDQIGGSVRVTDKGEAAYRIGYFKERRITKIKENVSFIMSLVIGICTIAALWISVIEIKSINDEINGVKTYQQSLQLQVKQLQLKEQLEPKEKSHPRQLPNPLDTLKLSKDK